MGLGKRHLPSSLRPPVRRSACGINQPKRWSFVPREVDCIACKSTVKMADAEVAFAQRESGRLTQEGTR